VVAGRPSEHPPPGRQPARAMGRWKLDRIASRFVYGRGTRHADVVRSAFRPWVVWLHFSATLDARRQLGCDFVFQVSRFVRSRGVFVPLESCKVITLACLRKWVAGVELACPASPRRSVRSGGGFVLRGWLKINTLVRGQSWVAGVELACPASRRRSGFGAGSVPLREPTPAAQVVWLGGGFVSQNRIVIAT
jgi:hypothetical protein